MVAVEAYGCPADLLGLNMTTWQMLETDMESEVAMNDAMTSIPAHHEHGLRARLGPHNVELEPETQGISGPGLGDRAM